MWCLLLFNIHTSVKNQRVKFGNKFWTIGSYISGVGRGGTPERSPPPRNRKNCCRNLGSSEGLATSGPMLRKFLSFEIFQFWQRNWNQRIWFYQSHARTQNSFPGPEAPPDSGREPSVYVGLRMLPDVWGYSRGPLRRVCFSMEVDTEIPNFYIA